MAENDIYWEVKRDGVRVAYGSINTLPSKSQRQALRSEDYSHALFAGFSWQLFEKLDETHYMEVVC